MKNYIEEDSHNGILSSDLFRLDKSYDQIMADHCLIKQMKNILEQSVLHGYITHYPFEELIKEAYFQCGIIQRRPCCRNYYDYWQVFINRNRYISGLNDRDRIMIVGGMVFLLLFTQKKMNVGTATIIDEIWKNVKHDLDLCFSPVNPFEKLLNCAELHEIDFGVSPLPIDAGQWKNVYWGRIEKMVEEDDDCYIDELDDYNKMLNGTFDEKAYSRKYINSVQVILDAIGFKTIQEQHSLLNIIMEKDLFYICEEKIPQCMIPCSGCEYPYECVEHEIYNGLRKSSIEKLKEKILTKYSEDKGTESVIINSIQCKKTNKRKKDLDFCKNITKPEFADCVLKRLHELIDRQESATEKIKPLCAAMVAGIVRREKSYAKFCAEFGHVTKSLYYKYTIINKYGRSLYYDGLDFELLIDEFRNVKI